MNPNFHYVLSEIEGEAGKLAYNYSKGGNAILKATKALRRMLSGAAVIPKNFPPHLLMDPKLVKMLKAYIKVEQLSERDWKKWSPIEQASTWGMMEHEWKPKIAERLLELYKAQYPPKAKR